MKQIALMRHAKSSWKDSGLTDIERPLNKRGLHDAPRMGDRLARNGFRCDCIYSSPAKRAIKTARIVADCLGYPLADIRLDEDIYLADHYTLLDIAQQLDDTLNSVMFFGHNPGFTVFVNRLGDLSLDNLPTSGVAIFDLNIERWRDAAFGSGKLQHFDFPKNANSLGDD